ncbi:MAG: SpoIIE family protein phosphatase [Ignavibacteria bacterium]|nr:SpoIIE family protein phosphatase [Ignavibacteria bacterium]
MENNDPVRKQLELNSLIEFSQLISSKLDLKYILNNILLSTMGKMLISKGMMLIRIDAKKEDGLFVIESLKGLDQHLAGTEVKAIFPKLAVFDSTELDNGYSYLTDLGLHHFFKVYFQNKLLGVLCLGKKLNNTSLSNSEVVSIETMLNISASAIENTIRFNEVKSLNADLNNRVRQLKSLFELSKEFNSSIIDKDSIIKVLSFTLLGNFGIKDFIIFSRGKDDKFSLIKDSRKISAEEISPNEVFPLQSTSDKMKKTIRISDFTESEFFSKLYETGFELVIPAVINNEVENIICLGGKLNKLPYSESDIEFLESIVNLSLISIQNSMLFKEYLEKQVMENELKIAREIQVALLPGSIPDIKGYDFAGMNMPAKRVGGDYFDIIKLTDCKTAVVIADVSGKGTPASLLMATIQAAVHSYLKMYDDESFDLASVTEKINELVYENTMPEKFITFFWGILDCKENKLKYINAGHNPPLLFRKDGIYKLDKGGFMIGILDKGIDYEVGEVSLVSGDTMVFYTDGVTEAQDVNEEEFGEDRLEKLCSGNVQLDSKELMKLIADSVIEFSTGTSQYDDITLIVGKKG